MADPRALVKTSFAKRLTQAMNYGLTGDFFSPQSPQAPTYPNTAGRRFDYLPGYNVATKPRRDSGIDFQMLRNFAQYYDMLRILIEKRKDQICNFEWSIVPTDEAVAAAGVQKLFGGKPGKVLPDNNDNNNMGILQKRADQATKFLKLPDGRNKWNIWLRSIIEDMLVLDAIALWPVYKGNECIRLETVDPATIKLVIDDSGRSPEPPYPAYQQVLHGVTTSDYMKDELQYFISNPASNRIYGLSKVEQILITVQIGMRRQISQLQLFTEGNVPAALAGVPDSWTPSQIKMLQESFDAMIAGDTGAKRKIWFVPGDAAKNIKEMRSEEATLKGTIDEWLIRVMCFNFGIAPTPFINQVNRATAFTAQEEARDEGLGPSLTFLKSVIDSLILKALKLEGIEFKWSMEAENDPSTQADIDDKMLRNGSRSIDELRQRDGLDPIGVAQLIYTGTGAIPVKNIINGTAPGMVAPPPPVPPQMGPDGKPMPPKGNAAPGQQKPGQPPAKGGKQPPNDKNAAQKDKDVKDVAEGEAQVHKAEVSARSTSPFRKKFSYPSSIVRDPKGDASKARLIKASRQNRS